MTEIYVPFEFHPDAGPNACFLNVEDRVAADGGALVCGWAVRTEYHGTLRVFYHHAVWRKPTGELVDVTPKLSFDGVVRLTATRFVPDPAALPLGTSPHRMVRPARVEPAKADPDLRRAADCLQFSEEAYYDRKPAACREWTRRAEDALNRYFRRKKKREIWIGLPNHPRTTF